MAQKAGGAESQYMAREDDDGADRPFWKVKLCPRHTFCEGQPWKKAACWSYESPAQAELYLIRHLMWSGKHNKGQEEAEEIAKEAEIEVFTETGEEREDYRVRLENAVEQVEEVGPTAKRQKVGPTAKPKPPNQAPPSEMSVAHLARTVGVLSSLVKGMSGHPPPHRPPMLLDLQPSGSRPSGSSSPLGIDATSLLQDLNNNIERALEAMNNATSTMITCIRTVNEEGMRLKAAHSQFQTHLR